MSARSKALQDEGTKTQVVIAGATAGLISRFCIAPLDVVKIRLQLQVHTKYSRLPSSVPIVHQPSPYHGTLSTFRSIIIHEGVTALWKGNLPASHLYVLYSTLQFTTYHILPPLLSPLNLPIPLTTFVSGATSGALATTLTYPLDLLRTRFAAQSTQPPIYLTLRSSFLTIYRAEGPAGFFRGLPAAVLQIVPYMGLFFATYETLRRTLATVGPLPFGGSDASAGTMASVVAKTAVFPLDLVRKRLQVQGPSRTKYVFRAGEGVPVYTGGVWGTVRDVVRREGLRGLYRGLGVGLVKAAPAGAVTMWVYEGVLGELTSVRGD